jgi:hypothetical protein
MTDPVTDTTMFNKDDGTTVPPVTTTVTPDPVTAPQPDLNQVFSESLAGIKNEAGEQKYNDVFTALAALKHTQDHVKTLENENAAFKQENVTAQSMDDVLAQLQATNNNQSVQTSTPALDVEAQRNVTLATIQQYEQQKAAEANQQAVETALVGKYKDATKAAEAFTAKANDLGIDVKTLEALAAQSPKAVLEYFGTSSSATNPIVGGSVNTDALANSVQPVVEKKQIMFGATSADLVNAWRAAKPPTE